MEIWLPIVIVAVLAVGLGCGYEFWWKPKHQKPVSTKSSPTDLQAAAERPVTSPSAYTRRLEMINENIRRQKEAQVKRDREQDDRQRSLDEYAASLKAQDAAQKETAAHLTKWEAELRQLAKNLKNTAAEQAAEKARLEQEREFISAQLDKAHELSLGGVETDPLEGIGDDESPPPDPTPENQAV